MRKIVNQIKVNTFLKYNAIFFFGSLLVSFLNYLYSPILGRILKLSSYGEVQTLVSLLTQLTLFLSVLGQVITNIVANYTDEAKRQAVIFELEKLAFMINALICFIILVFSEWLKSFFKFDSIWPFVVLCLWLLVLTPLNFRAAYLRGKKLFGAVSISSTISAASRIVLSAVLVIIGFKTMGALGGIIAANILSYIYTTRKARQAGYARPKNVSYLNWPNLKAVAPEIKFSLLVLVGSVFVTLLSSIDLFVVKHYFSSDSAGRYAGISIASNAIFYLTGSISQVLMSTVRISADKKDNRRLLIGSLLLVSAIGGSVTLIFVLIPHIIVSIFMGSAYTAYSSLLPPLSIAMFLLSVISLVVYYYVSLRMYKIGFIVSLGALFVISLMIINHGSLNQVVMNLVYGNLALLGMIGVWIALNHKSSSIDSPHA